MSLNIDIIQDIISILKVKPDFNDVVTSLKYIRKQHKKNKIYRDYYECSIDYMYSNRVLYLFILSATFKFKTNTFMMEIQIDMDDTHIIFRCSSAIPKYTKSYFIMKDDEYQYENINELLSELTNEDNFKTIVDIIEANNIETHNKSARSLIAE